MLSITARYFLVIAAVVYVANAYPLLGLEDESGDTAIVESTIREVRAAKDSDLAPANYHRVYDSGDKGDKGYTRQKSDKGKTGYQKFDSFHKKDGDSYGYEKHDSFGHKDQSKAGTNSGKASYKQKKGDGKSAKYQAADDSGSYEVNEDSDEDYDSGESNEGEGDDVSHYDGEQASQAEGGVEESGYDENDAVNYDNPPAYTYGSGNEYDFK